MVDQQNAVKNQRSKPSSSTMIMQQAELLLAKDERSYCACCCCILLLSQQRANKTLRAPKSESKDAVNSPYYEAFMIPIIFAGNDFLIVEN